MIHRVANEKEMMEFGCRCAHRAKPGSVWWLSGELGAGKTHWAKGFVSGLGSKAAVTSPTFGLLHEYADGSIPVFHYDFYRLESADELLAMGWDETLDQDGIVIVEWGNKFDALMPQNAVRVTISVEADGSRTIEIVDRRS